MRLRLSVLLVVPVLFLSACGQSPVQERTLANGLHVIVKVDNRSPVVVQQIWYRVGSIDEPAGKGGISHVLEHMMFKGTQRVGPGEFSKIIARNGGRENAFTNTDYTAYFQTLEKSRLPIAMELEADRMHNLVIDPKEFSKEVAVVMEERRLRTDDKPEGRLYESFRATSFHAHPYGKPIIGTMQELRSLTAEDLTAWYKRWYAPNNATLVIVGDVEPEAVFELARKYYGGIPSQKLPARSLPAEPPQKAMRRITLRIPAQVPQMLIGFHTPVLKGTADEWEPYALDVLAGVLDGGDSARFTSHLIREQQVAAGAGAGYDDVARAPSQFMIQATPFNGKTVASLEKALIAEIDKLKNEPVSDAELNRIKAQVIAEDVYQQDSMFYQGMEIGMLTVSGLNWHVGEHYVERINGITAKQVMAVARKYLVPENMTVAILEPVHGGKGAK